MFGKKDKQREYSLDDNRAVFHYSLHAANEAWKAYLREKGACKERIVFDPEDGLPRNQLTMRKNLPFLRYSFRSKRQLEKVMRSTSFIAKTGKSKDMVSLKDLEIGYYRNEVSGRWELFVWGNDLDRTLIREWETACEANRGDYISSYVPELENRGTSTTALPVKSDAAPTQKEPIRNVVFGKSESGVSDIMGVLASMEISSEMIGEMDSEAIVSEISVDREPVVEFRECLIRRSPVRKAARGEGLIRSMKMDSSPSVTSKMAVSIRIHQSTAN